MKLRYYWKSLLMTGVILFLSFARLSPIENVPQFRFSDKIAHFMLYVIYTLFLMYEYRKTEKSADNLRYLFVCILWPVMLGGITEISQSMFFPPRHSDWFDFLSNTTGVLIGWGLFYLFRKRFIKT